MTPPIAPVMSPSYTKSQSMTPSVSMSRKKSAWILRSPGSGRARLAKYSQSRPNDLSEKKLILLTFFYCRGNIVRRTIARTATSRRCPRQWWRRLKFAGPSSPETAAWRVRKCAPPSTNQVCFNMFSMYEDMWIYFPATAWISGWILIGRLS